MSTVLKALPSQKESNLELINATLRSAADTGCCKIEDSQSFHPTPLTTLCNIYWYKRVMLLARDYLMPSVTSALQNSDMNDIDFPQASFKITAFQFLVLRNCDQAGTDA